MGPLLLPALALAAPPDAPAPTRDRPGEVMPDRDWDLRSLSLEVRVDPAARALSGRATHTLGALGRPSGLVRLHQAGLALSEVTVDGAPAEGWRTVGEWLEVPVPADRAEVVIGTVWTATPQTGFHFRGGPGAPPGERLEAWTQGEGEDNRHWFPSWDHPNDKFVVSTTVIAPPGLIARANGELAAQASLPDGWTSWSFRLDRPIVNYLVAVVVGDYETFELPGRIPLEAVVPRGTGRDAALRTLDPTGPQLDFFEGLLGEPYPYPLYRQAVVQRFLYGGMENAALTTLTHDALVLDARELPGSRADNLLAHELAHQWFGDLLTCYGWRELWLNEGFATFYAGRWQEHDQGEARMAALVRRWHEAALREEQAPMAARSHTKVDGRDNAAVYVKGASLLHLLRVTLGDGVFDAAIRDYVAAHRDRLVESEDLRRALEDASGRHLGWAFDQWVTGTGVAELSSKHTFRDGALEVVIEQPKTTFWVPVQVEVPGVAPIRELMVGPGTTRLQLPLERAPDFVAVDPRGGALARFEHAQSTGQWIAQAKGSAFAFARLEAVARLGDGKPEDDALTTLEALARDAAEPLAIREAALDALASLEVPRAVAALAAALSDPEVTLRRAAAEGLGALDLPQGDGADALERAAKDEREVPSVRAEALRSLARVDEGRGVLLARAWLGRPDRNPRGPLHRAALDVLGGHGEEKDLGPLLARIDEDREPIGVTRAAAAAAVSRLRELDEAVADRWRPRVSRALDALLASPDLRLRQSAVSWLGQAGDEASVAALEALADANRVSGLSEQALDAARLIRGRSRPKAEPPESEDLKRLEEKLKALEERLEELETWR